VVLAVNHNVTLRPIGRSFAAPSKKSEYWVGPFGGKTSVWCRSALRPSVCVSVPSGMYSSLSLRQTVHTHRTSVHQAAKLVAALAGVTADLTESNGSLPPGL